MVKTLGGTVVAKNPEAPKGIIYGPPGVGKSTYAATIPTALLIDCENGAGAIDCIRTPYLSTWDEIYDWLSKVLKEEHEHKAIVIDSLDWMLRRIEENVTGKSLESTLNGAHGGYGKGRQVLRNYIYSELIPLLNKILSKGIAVIMLAHAKRTDVTDIDGIVTEKTAPELPEGYLNTFVEWADFVCLARIADKGERVLITQETSRAMAKNRYNLPTTLPMNWNAFIQARRNGLAKTFKAVKSKSKSQQQ